jgi:hypothetical protein
LRDLSFGILLESLLPNHGHPVLIEESNRTEILRYLEFGLSPAAILLLILYHVLLYRKMRCDPLSTSMGLAHRARSLWVQTIMNGGKDILAVQTLRNWTMASTFLASTAILIGLGIFNLAVTADKQGELSLMISHFGSNHPGRGSASSSCWASISCLHSLTLHLPCATSTTPAS